MVDTHAVHQALAEPAPDLDVGCVEYGAVLLAESSQRGDGEEPPIPAPPASPPGQPIVLAVMDFGARPRTGARRDRIHQIAQPQHITVDLEVGDVVVGTQYRQHDSAAVEIPVDIEIGGVRGTRGRAVSTSHHHGFC